MNNSFSFSATPTLQPSHHAVVGSFPHRDVTHHHRYYFQTELDAYECISNLSGLTPVPGIHFNNTAFWLTVGPSACSELLCEVTNFFVNELFERLQLMRLPARFYIAGLPTQHQFTERNYSSQVATDMLLYLYRSFVICAEKYVPSDEKMFLHNISIGYTDSFFINQFKLKRHGK